MDAQGMVAVRCKLATHVGGHLARQGVIAVCAPVAASEPCRVNRTKSDSVPLDKAV
jgi:hypothetical protein